MDSIAHPKPFPLSTETRLARFRSKLAGLSRATLLRNVDLLLDQADRAKANGDRWLAAWALARWNAIWDELDRRDGIPGSGRAA